MQIHHSHPKTILLQWLIHYKSIDVGEDEEEHSDEDVDDITFEDVIDYE